MTENTYTRREALKGGSAGAVAVGASILSNQLIEAVKAQTNQPKIEFGQEYEIYKNINKDFVIQNKDTNTELRYDKDSDIWLIDNIQPKQIGQSVYVDHPDIGTPEDAWDLGTVAILGTGNYGDITFTGEALFLRGRGADSITSSIDINNYDNCVVTYTYVDIGTLTLSGNAGNFSKGYLAGTDINITGNVNRFMDNLIIGGSITIDGNYNQIGGNVSDASLIRPTITINGDNNFVGGNTGFDVVDNGTGNIWQNLNT